MIQIKQIVLRSIIIVAFAICQMSCNPEVEMALDIAGENRTEMEKVLDHFRNDENPLKYEAAQFLVANMPFHGTIWGTVIDQYDTVYYKTAEQPLSQRDKAFKSFVQQVNYSSAEQQQDIHAMKADYLIQAIDQACEKWCQSEWSKVYSKQLFFDYVLPYRILEEPHSDWQSYLAKEYPELGADLVRSIRGPRYELENAETHCEVQDAVGASGGKMAFLNQSGDSVVLILHSEVEARKSLWFRYASSELSPTVFISVNGENTDSLVFNASNDDNTYIFSRRKFDIMLHKGENRLRIAFGGKPVRLDAVHLLSIEPLAREEIQNYPSGCIICNEKTGKVITFHEPANRRASSLLTLADPIPDNPWQQLNLCMRGYGCYTLSPVAEPIDSLCMEAQYNMYNIGTRVSQYYHHFSINQHWVILPAGNGLYRIMGKDSGLYLEATQQNDSIWGMMLNTYAENDAQLWHIDYDTQAALSQPRFNPAILEATKVLDYMYLWEWSQCSANIPPRTSVLFECRTGNCREESRFEVSMCRYLGIPATIDFTPHWGNRSQAHEWPVLINHDGKAVPFHIKALQGDTANFYHAYKKPKVLRHKFGLNHDFTRTLHRGKAVPGSQYKLPCLNDVTAEYGPVTSVTRPVPDSFASYEVAYICVFDNRNWVPVFWGDIDDGEVVFNDMAREIMYIAGVLEHGRILTFGTPFSIDAQGNVHDVTIDYENRQQMTLFRKFPFLGEQDLFNTRMSRGRFQGSNTSDFVSTTDLYYFEGITDGNWYEVASKDTVNAFRYVRYIGPNGSYCNINEMQWFDCHGKDLNGKIIGTQGKGGKEKETVFDSNILTGFEGISPDGHWVGLDLGFPQQIGKIRFIGRNDGNTVEIGDKYEFYYWDHNEWNLIDTRIATENSLVYDTVPGQGLYVLKDRTKGWEERIFTYEEGKQIWW